MTEHYVNSATGIDKQRSARGNSFLIHELAAMKPTYDDI